MISEDGGNALVVIEHAALLYYVRHVLVLPLIREVGGRYWEAMPSPFVECADDYEQLDSSIRLDAFKRAASEQQDLADRVWFGVGPGDGFWCHNALGASSADGEEGFMVGDVPDDPVNDINIFADQPSPTEMAGHALYGMDPIYATAKLAHWLTSAIPTMLLHEACRFAVTGDYPETRELLVERRKADGLIAGYSITVAVKHPNGNLKSAIGAAVGRIDGLPSKEWKEIPGTGLWEYSRLGNRMTVAEAIELEVRRFRGGKQSDEASLMYEIIRGEGVPDDPADYLLDLKAADKPEWDERWTKMRVKVNDAIREMRSESMSEDRSWEDDHYKTNSALRKAYKEAAAARFREHLRPNLEEAKDGDAGPYGILLADETSRKAESAKTARGKTYRLVRPKVQDENPERPTGR